MVLIKDFLIKKRVNVNADESNFLANKTVRLILGLYVLNNIIQNISRPKLNYKIFNCALKNTKTLTAFLKKEKYLESFLVNLSDMVSKFIFSEFKASFANPFSKRLISVLSI